MDLYSFEKNLKEVIKKEVPNSECLSSPFIGTRYTIGMSNLDTWTLIYCVDAIKQAMRCGVGMKTKIFLRVYDLDQNSYIIKFIL